jgi:hypothetical protein
VRKFPLNKPEQVLDYFLSEVCDSKQATLTWYDDFSNQYSETSYTCDHVVVLHCCSTCNVQLSSYKITLNKRGGSVQGSNHEFADCSQVFCLVLLIQRSDSILSLRKQEIDNFLRAAKLTRAISRADFINFKIRVRVNTFSLYKLKCPLVCVKP